MEIDEFYVVASSGDSPQRSREGATGEEQPTDGLGLPELEVTGHLVETVECGRPDRLRFRFDLTDGQDPAATPRGHLHGHDVNLVALPADRHLGRSDQDRFAAESKRIGTGGRMYAVSAVDSETRF